MRDDGGRNDDYDGVHRPPDERLDDENRGYNGDGPDDIVIRIKR